MSESATAITLTWKWTLPDDWLKLALSERTDWTADHARQCAKLFHSYHLAKHTERSSNAEWLSAWRFWVLRQRTDVLKVRKSKVSQWWTSAAGVEEKSKELGIKQGSAEHWPYFRDRVLLAAGRGPWLLNRGKN